MYRITLTMLAVLIAAASVASTADASRYHKRTDRQSVVHTSRDITSFSSSSVHVHVNHPPKYR
jgi:hypothetical protein